MIFMQNIIWVILIIVNTLRVIRNVICLLANKKKKDVLGSKLIEEKKRLRSRLIFVVYMLLALVVTYGMYIAFRYGYFTLILMDICVLLSLLDQIMMFTHKKSIYMNGIFTTNQIILIDDILSSSLRSYEDRTELDFSYNDRMKLLNPNHLIFRIDNKDKDVVEKVIMIYQPS